MTTATPTRPRAGTRTVTKRQAAATLAALREQYAPLLAVPGQSAPVLHEPGFHADGWTIAWEENTPTDWALHALVDEMDAELYDRLREQNVPKELAHGIAVAAAYRPPAGVRVEPVSHWCIGLYVDD